MTSKYVRKPSDTSNLRTPQQMLKEAIKANHVLPDLYACTWEIPTEDDGYDDDCIVSEHYVIRCTTIDTKNTTLKGRFVCKEYRFTSYIVDEYGTEYELAENVYSVSEAVFSIWSDQHKKEFNDKLFCMSLDEEITSLHCPKDTMIK